MFHHEEEAISISPREIEGLQMRGSKESKGFYIIWLDLVDDHLKVYRIKE